MLAGGAGLSLAANLAQAQPTAWGQVTAAIPCGAFLVAVSMIERRAARRAPGRDDAGPGPGPRPPDRPRTARTRPCPRQPPASPAADGGGGPSGPGQPPVPARDGQDEAVLAAARRAAAEHQAQHGQPISRDALRARLGISNQAASGLLRQLRSETGRPPGASRAA